LHLSLDFDPAMLRWDIGGSRYDGVWAKHWYGAVHRSTGFYEPEGQLPRLPKKFRALERQVITDYEEMMEYCI